MNSKRSYLDTLNAGRQRRVHASLEELSRSVDGLGRHLDEGLATPAPRSKAGKVARDAYWAETDMGFSPRPATPRGGPAVDAGAYQSVTREIDRARRQDEGLASAARIAQELKGLREELRHQMSAGLRREFESLRNDIQRAAVAAPAGRAPEFGAEFERLSDAVHALSAKSDDKGLTMLRLELEQLKSALDNVAREDTVRAVGSRWDDFDRRWSKLEDHMERRASSSGDPAIDALSVRLEQINEAVNGLPESLSLRSLEEKVRMLAGALDHFARRQEDHGAGILGMIEERLDEISRAIVASAATVQAPQFDPVPFERVEARITSLARQIEELVEDRPSETLFNHIENLARRVDEIAERGKLPERMMERFAAQIADIADRLDAGQQAPDAEAILKGIEHRFDTLSDLFDRRQGDAIEQGHALFRDLERRLDDVAARLDARPQAIVGTDTSAIMDTIDQRFADLARRVEERTARAGSSDSIRQIEMRLDDISARLDSAPGMGSIDGQIVHRLEEQVAELTRALARPNAASADLEELGPRLDDIEKSINDSRTSVLEAARDAAANAVKSLAVSSPESAAAAAALTQDLKALDQLTRRSEERNTKTFEAIHETLLKIVDRLTALETVPAGRPARTVIDETPSFDRAEDIADQGRREVPSRRTPAQAAAAAAVAALDQDDAIEAAGEGRVRSMLGGISRAFTKKERAEPALAGSAPAEPTVDMPLGLDAPIDPAAANRPLEPGSGAPDLNAIIRRVREEKGGAPSDAEAAKSDFIAAARRAAQAAAADAGIGRKGAEPGTTGGKGRLADLLRTRRKPILMGAVAILVALAGLQLGKAFFRDTAPAKVADAQVEAPAETDRQVSAVTPPARADVQDNVGSPVRVVEEREDLAQADGADEFAEFDETATEPVPPAEESVAAIEPSVPALPEPAPVEAGPVALREAADAGDAKAMFEIGSRYAEGRGVQSDMAVAAKWYERGAEHGFAPAQYRIGNFYEKGIGVGRDIAKAKTWYQMSAEQGNASAMHNLAVLFAMGADGMNDNESAARWFIRAAELGVKDSQFNLGILAAKGVGMEQNLEESYKWFALVAKTGDKDAATKRDEVANALRPDQLTRARAAVELWKPKPVDPAANSVDIPDAWKESSGTTASVDNVDMKKAIQNIQAILNNNGYDAGNPDGVMGNRTKAAIAAFQADNGLDATGEVDDKLVRALLEKK